MVDDNDIQCRRMQVKWAILNSAILVYARYNGPAYNGLSDTTDHYSA